MFQWIRYGFMLTIHLYNVMCEGREARVLSACSVAMGAEEKEEEMTTTIE